MIHIDWTDPAALTAAATAAAALILLALWWRTARKVKALTGHLATAKTAVETVIGAVELLNRQVADLTQQARPTPVQPITVKHPTMPVVVGTADTGPVAWADTVMGPQPAPDPATVVIPVVTPQLPDTGPGTAITATTLIRRYRAEQAQRNAQ